MFAGATSLIIFASLYGGPIAPCLVGGIGGGSAQMISNIWNEADLMANVTGATLGGAIAATGHFFAAALIN